MTDATLSFNLLDALGEAYDYTRGNVWLEFNTETGWIVDENGKVRADAGVATLNADGSGSLEGVPVPSVSTNPPDFQVRIRFSVPPRLPDTRNRRQHMVGDFGWFTVTGDADIKDLVEEQYAPPTWMTTATGTLQGYVDQGQDLLAQQVELSGIEGTDSAVGALMGNEGIGPLTRAATRALVADDIGDSGSDIGSALTASYTAPEGVMLGTIGAPGPRLPVIGVEPGHPWTAELVGSSNLNDTSTFPVGTQSVRFTTDGAGTGGRITALGRPAVDLTGYNVGVWLRIDGIANLDQVNIYAGHAALSKTFVWTPVRGTDLNPWALDGEWVFHTLNIGDANVSTSPNRTAITDWRIRALDKGAGNVVTINVGPVMLVPKHADWPNGVVSITTDDGYLDNYTLMRPTLDKYGQPATLYIIRDLLGTSGKVTEAQVNEMRERSGWEIAQHGDTIADHDATFPNLSTANLKRTVRDLKKWLAGRGHLRGAEQVAYPQGKFTASVMETLRPYVTTARTVTGTTRETLPPADPMRLRAVTGISSAGTTVAATKGLIDKAHAEGQWLILVFHRIVSGTAANSIECSVADLEEICAYIAAKGIPCRTVGDVAASMSSPKPPPTPIAPPASYPPIYARSALDTTRNNTATLAADPALTVPVVAGAIYEVRGMVTYSASTAADLQIGWNYPSGSTMEWTPDGLSIGTTGLTGQMNRTRLAINGVGQVGGAGPTAGSRAIATPRGLLTAGADGNLTLTWAQAVAEASDATVYAGSYLTVQRIA